MYLSQELCGAKLKEIAQAFNLNSIGSISTHIAKLKLVMRSHNFLLQQIDKITSEYDTAPFHMENV